MDFVVRDVGVALLGLGEDALPVGDAQIQAAQPVAAPVGRLHKADVDIVERHVQHRALAAHRQAGDLAPQFRQPDRIRPLQLHRGVVHGDGLIHLVEPLGAAGRFPVAGEVVGFVPVDLEERRLHVARMDLADVPVVAVHFPRDAHAVVQGALPHRLLVGARIRLADHHVAAVAVAPIQIAPGSGVLFHRHHHFEQVAADRQQRVDEAEPADARIDEAAVDAEDLLQVVDGGVQLPGNEADLAKLNGHVGSSRVEGMARPKRVSSTRCSEIASACGKSRGSRRCWQPVRRSPKPPSKSASAWWTRTATCRRQQAARSAPRLGAARRSKKQGWTEATIATSPAAQSSVAAACTCATRTSALPEPAC